MQVCRAEAGGLDGAMRSPSPLHPARSLRRSVVAWAAPVWGAWGWGLLWVRVGAVFAASGCEWDGPLRARCGGRIAVLQPPVGCAALPRTAPASAAGVATLEPVPRLHTAAPRDGQIPLVRCCRFDSGLCFPLCQPRRCWALRSTTSPVTCGPSASSCTFCKSNGSLSILPGSEGGDAAFELICGVAGLSCTAPAPGGAPCPAGTAGEALGAMR